MPKPSYIAAQILAFLDSSPTCRLKHIGKDTYQLIDTSQPNGFKGYLAPRYIKTRNYQSLRVRGWIEWADDEMKDHYNLYRITDAGRAALQSLPSWKRPRYPAAI